MLELHNTLGPWLGKTSKMLSCLIGEVFQEKNIDLTRNQLIFLMKLHKKDGVPQSELAIITERDKASLTRLVNTMERKGFVERKQATKDKRIKLVFLTEKGRKEFNKAKPIMRKIITQLQANLTDKEIQDTINSIQKVQNNLAQLSSNCGFGKDTIAYQSKEI